MHAQDLASVLGVRRGVEGRRQGCAKLDLDSLVDDDSLAGSYNPFTRQVCAHVVLARHCNGLSCQGRWCVCGRMSLYMRASVCFNV